MHVIADLNVTPLGVGSSISSYVAACEKVIREAGLNCRLHAYGTNVEGSWEDVSAVVRRCHDVLHEMGAPRVNTSLKLGTRTDKAQSMDDRIAKVESLLGE